MLKLKLILLVLCVALLNPGCKKDEPTNNNNNNNNNQVQPLDMKLLHGTTSKKWYPKYEQGYMDLPEVYNDQTYFEFTKDSLLNTNVKFSHPRLNWTYRFKGKDEFKRGNTVQGTKLQEDHYFAWWYLDGNNERNYDIYRFRILELTENRLVIQGLLDERVNSTRQLFVTR
jgi:hypothetical protein